MILMWNYFGKQRLCVLCLRLLNWQHYVLWNVLCPISDCSMIRIIIKKVFNGGNKNISIQSRTCKIKLKNITVIQLSHDFYIRLTEATWSVQRWVVFSYIYSVIFTLVTFGEKTISGVLYNVFFTWIKFSVSNLIE